MCCETLKQAISDRFIIGYSKILSIRGPAHFVNDGDGHMDDMTDEKNISFCPFCGKKI
jgi:hypothetical protein